jgi:hypothetical protein
MLLSGLPATAEQAGMLADLVSIRILLLKYPLFEGRVPAVKNQCEVNASCVSPSAWRSPAQYMPAWDYAPSSQEQAFREAVNVLDELEADGRAEILVRDAAEWYLKARIQFSFGGAASQPWHVVFRFGTRWQCIRTCAAGRPDYDIVEIWLRTDQIATFRVQSEVNLPSPPGCWRRNCINGPRT